jgi:branched-subunit amino acid aminotransferase/4-amino-4-deoxychorismate lyase
MFISINGRIIPADQGTIHYQDRGFRFGDGVFETIRIHDGIPYLWEAHWQRLQQGIETLNIPIDIIDCDTMARELIHANQINDAVLRISISRGVGSRGYLPTDITAPTLLMETLDLPPAPPQEIHLCVSELRRIPPLCLPTHLKLSQGLNSILARMSARDQGCFDAIMLSIDNQIAECSSFNILWAQGNTLYAPSLDTGCIAGVTAAHLFRHMPWKLKLGRYSMAHLLKADAVVICNSTSLVLPVHGIYAKQGKLITFSKSTQLSERCRVFFEQNMAEYALDRSE